MSQLALALCCGLILWLFRKDMAWRRMGAGALWVPAVWIAIQGSRPVSYWFGQGGGSESNPINTFVFALLIGLAVVILGKRGLNWGTFFQQNKAICLVYCYFLLSVFWSEIPVISLKRLLKDFGCVLVALVFLLEFRPAEAIRAVYVRVSYILFPLSVLFIKYFPDIGRGRSRAGETMFGGVTTQKNSLGETVFVFGIVILWDLIEIFKSEDRRGKRMQILIRFGMLLMGLWLLVTCDSQTSMMCLVVGACILWGAQRLLQMRNGRRVLITILVCIVSLVMLDKTFGLSEMIIRALGRDPSLTGRTNIWQILLAQKTDPFLGDGFYAFWDSSKGEAVVETYSKLNSAHNGYLDLYLDGGILGIALLIIFMLMAGRRVINRLFSGHLLGKVGLVYWLLAILYNFSESSFFRLDVLWFTLLLVTIECQQRFSKSMVEESYGQAHA